MVSNVGYFHSTSLLMKRYAKLFSMLTLLVSCFLLFSGCLKTKITTDKAPSNETVELPWAHGFVLGLVPPVNAPLQVKDQCENGVSEVYFRQSFIQLIAQGVTQSIYTPQKFTVTCASGGSMSSVETPPSYLLRDRDETSSETLTAEHSSANQ